jgi:hypothetical protein
MCFIRNEIPLLVLLAGRSPSCLLVRNFMGNSVGILMMGGRTSINKQQLMIIDWTKTPDKWEIKDLNDWYVIPHLLGGSLNNIFYNLDKFKNLS